MSSTCPSRDDLAGMEGLEHLYVFRTALSVESVARLKRALSECEIRSDFSAEQIAEAMAKLKTAEQ